MNTYPTVLQATGVARTLSKHWGCTFVVYKTPAAKFVTARPNEAIEGEVQSVYRNGYVVPTVLSKAR